MMSPAGSPNHTVHTHTYTYAHTHTPAFSDLAAAAAATEDDHIWWWDSHGKRRPGLRKGGWLREKNVRARS